MNLISFVIIITILLLNYNYAHQGYQSSQKSLASPYYNHFDKNYHSDKITTVSADFVVLSGKSRKLIKRWKRNSHENDQHGNSTKFLTLLTQNDVLPREFEDFSNKRLNDQANENKERVSKSYKIIDKKQVNKTHHSIPINTLTTSTHSLLQTDNEELPINGLLSSYGPADEKEFKFKQKSTAKVKAFASKPKIFGASTSSESITPNSSDQIYGSDSNRGLNRDSEVAVSNTANELDPKQQVITGIPDLSDPCFRRYANSIIVNAQPYERRSSISLVNCKSQCLRSQLGVYSCRSFIYDNINQVCDLFAHVGDQPPARLLRFQTRDYFEPTSAIHCTLPQPSSSTHLSDDALATAFGTVSSVVQTLPGSKPHSQLTALPQSISVVTPFPAIVKPPLPQPLTTTNQTPSINRSGPVIASIFEQGRPQLPQDTNSAQIPSSSNSNAPKMHSNLLQEVEPAYEENPTQCGANQVTRFLKTRDFELHAHDDVKLEAVTLDECMEMCAGNMASRKNGSLIRCNSFEFNGSLGSGECVLSIETAVPLGNGQLKQRVGTDYFEKICVDQRLANECPGRMIYNRFPQMILVGFAETVVDAPSLQNCFDNCLNSRKLYGFRCTSGMFYFEEPQLNCILNTEDRASQPDLFTAESSDLVDYFEIGSDENCIANIPPAMRIKNFSSIRKSPQIKAENRQRSQFQNLTKIVTTKISGNGMREEWNYGSGIQKARDFVELIPPPLTSSFGKNSFHKGPIKSKVRPPSRSPPERIGWTEWSVCEKSSGRNSSEIIGPQNHDLGEASTKIGLQTRWKICVDQRVCAKEERHCQVMRIRNANIKGATGTIVMKKGASNENLVRKMNRLI